MSETWGSKENDKEMREYENFWESQKAVPTKVTITFVSSSHKWNKT